MEQNAVCENKDKLSVKVIFASTPADLLLCWVYLDKF